MRIGIIYKVTNLVNGKCYIGKTIKSLEERIQSHKDDIKRNRCESIFYNAIKKYGWENFKWEILYKNIPENMLDVAEMCAIYVNESTKDQNGYNLTEGGTGGNTLNLLSDEKRKERNKKISNTSINRICSNETREKISVSHGSKKFEVFDKNNNFIGEWINKRECARVLELNPRRIGEVLSGKKKNIFNLRNYIFSYTGE